LVDKWREANNPDSERAGGILRRPAPRARCFALYRQASLRAVPPVVFRSAGGPLSARAAVRVSRGAQLSVGRELRVTHQSRAPRSAGFFRKLVYSKSYRENQKA